MQATLIESADEHHLVLLDHRVTQLVFEPGTLRLQTWSLDGSAEVRLAAPFRLRLAAGGAERTLDPAAAETLAPVLALLRRGVESLTLTRSGTLTLAFRDGAAVVADASGRGAAWEVDGGGILEGLAYRGVAGVVPWG
ncbi:MAG TPA: DUF6188 family protein [Gemmatimonadaceae bacterium]|nr:DUF6188 family protein [Gemmatimonadaceae bacterium]